MLVLLLAAVLASDQPFQAVIDQVKATMRDPDSAQFRDIKQTGPDSYCGWVNGKNGFGGYAGFELFSDSAGSVEIINDEYLHLMERYRGMSENAQRLQKIAPCRG